MMIKSRTWILLPLLLLAPFARAQDAAPATQTWTPEHVAKLRLVGDVAISPDGAYVAYLLSVPRKPFEEDNGPAWAELHVVDREGNSRPFITGKVNVSRIEWSEDGAHVVYLAKRDGDENTSLYRIPLKGGESQRILAHDASIKEYSFSPDGTRVAFLAEEPESEADKKRKKHGFDAQVYEEKLRFTHVWIAAVPAPDAPAATGKDGAKPRRLEAIEGSASELHWSPAGDRLAVALAPTPLIDDHYMKRKVHVVDVESGATIARFDNPGKLGSMEWSPDGAHLAMISAADLNDPSEGRLMVAPGGGGALKDLLPDLQGHVTDFAWQGTDTVMFLADVGCHTSFEEVGIDGSGRHAIIEGGKRSMDHLSLSNASMSCALTIESDKHPFEVFTLSHANPTPVRLTDSNPWIGELRFARQEVVRYAARDGLQLEGVLVHPLERAENARVPLILAVHGGPEAHVKDGFVTSYSNPGQVAAARGMAVFYPNYRGSTGRGVEFSKLGQADYAGAEFDDLVDAVDHFVRTGLADNERIGITGGSYGGYATAWCSTKHSHRFAAGVMFVGISDILSKTGTSDIPEEMYLVHSRKRPWDDWNYYLERSPIRHVENARTPLLIMHGKDDPRVHPSQSLELYRQLKVLNQTPVRLVYFPGEGHGNRKAAARYDFNLRMLQWFEHYLKGDGGAPPPPDLEYALEPKPEPKKDAPKEEPAKEPVGASG